MIKSLRHTLRYSPNFERSTTCQIWRTNQPLHEKSVSSTPYMLPINHRDGPSQTVPLAEAKAKAKISYHDELFAKRHKVASKASSIGPVEGTVLCFTLMFIPMFSTGTSRSGYSAAAASGSSCGSSCPSHERRSHSAHPGRYDNSCQWDLLSLHRVTDHGNQAQIPKTKPLSVLNEVEDFFQ